MRSNGRCCGGLLAHFVYFIFQCFLSISSVWAPVVGMLPPPANPPSFVNGVQAHLTDKARLHPLLVSYWARSVVKMMLIPSQVYNSCMLPSLRCFVVVYYLQVFLAYFFRGVQTILVRIVDPRVTPYAYIPPVYIHAIACL